MGIYVDSNIIIFHLISDRKFGRLAKSFLKKVGKGEIRAFSSIYTLVEIYATLKHAFRIGEKRIGEVLEAVTLFGIEFLELDLGVIRDAIEIMKRNEMKFGDAIHIATMKRNGISVILSHDKDFDKVKGVKRVTLMEMK